MTTKSRSIAIREEPQFTTSKHRVLSGTRDGKDRGLHRWHYCGGDLEDKMVGHSDGMMKIRTADKVLSRKFREKITKNLVYYAYSRTQLYFT